MRELSHSDYNANYEKYSASSEKLMYKSADIYKKVFVTSSFIKKMSESLEKVDNNWNLEMIHTGYLVYDKNFDYKKIIHGEFTE